MFMDIEVLAITSGISSLVFGITLYAIYSSFGPNSKDLIDPFEEEDD